MANITGAGGDCGDLFGDAPTPRRDRPERDQKLRSDSASELTQARVLCRRLRRERARPDKKRIVHLICLNLLSMLRHTAPHA